MCSHYQAIRDRQRYVRHFGVMPPLHPVTDDKDKWPDLWPERMADMIRRPPEADAGDEAVPPRESLAGMFGLLPAWAKDTRLARNTYNARSETVASKPAFRDAWRMRRHCIIPCDAFFEPDWRSGRAVATRISRADGAPMGLAGLWSTWRAPTGDYLHSFTMLTIHADTHALMKNYHRPTDEKRMVVVLPDDRYDDWLTASETQAFDLLQPYPAEALVADPASAAFGASGASGAHGTSTLF